MAQTTYTRIRRAFVFLIGITVVLIGVVLLVTPGPAIVVIPAGLAILATEFVWARSLLSRLKETIKSRTSGDDGNDGTTPSTGSDPNKHDGKSGR